MTRPALFAATAAALLATAPAPKAKPRLEPVAETRLLMEGLLQANFRGFERLLRQNPADVESWTFLRGQALLIAESGNLLMMRPPKSSGQDAWQEIAGELRDRGTKLAQQAAARDPDRCRKGLADLAATCNRCHQTFRVEVRVAPTGEAQ